MEYLFESLKDACGLMVKLDWEFLHICWTSIWISTTATIVSICFALPVAIIIARHQFMGKHIITHILNTMMSIPTVTIGLLVYTFFCRKGIFGDLELLYTPFAMIIGQVMLATPVITALVVSSLSIADIRIEKTALTLGATRFQTMLLLISQMYNPIFSATASAFGRVFSEVGISIMVGGNIKHYTRNIPTAIATETNKGDFSLALALGIVLIVCAFIINLICIRLTKD